MSKESIDIIKRALAREKEARKAAERILEEKSAELFSLNQELQKSKAKLETLVTEKTSQLQGIFENIADAYVVMDLAGNVLKMNETASDLFSHTLDDGPLNVISLIYKDDYLYAMDSFKELSEKGHFTNYQARIFTKDKRVRWVQINASLVYDKDSNPVAAQGIVRDITHIKETNELIQEQKSQLDIILDNSSVGIVLTENGNFLKSNQTFRNLLGYSEEDISNLSIKDISLKEDFPLSKDKLEQMDAGKIDNFVIDKRYIKKDGALLWAKTNVSAIRDEHGKIKYQVALIEDVTLEREKALMLEVINQVAHSVLGKVDIHNIAWEITNKIADYLGTEDCVIYLVHPNENILEQIAAYGQKLASDGEIKDKISIPMGQGIVGSVAQSGKAERIGDTSKDPRYIMDDDSRLSEITVPILFDGEVIAVIDSEHPSKDYFTKDHLRTLRNIARLVSLQLKNAIVLKEREIVQQKNTILLEQLEKSNEELEEYAHIVSHDLKSPLRSIYALVNWIKEDNDEVLNEQSKENIQLIEGTLERMESLITGILNYSSINSDSLNKERIELNELLKDVMHLLYVPDHISVNIEPNLPIISGDRTRLIQLFQNLLGNALRYSDKEKGIIDVGVKEEEDHYAFFVKDNGIGIEKKYHKKIFKIFQSLNKHKESTGIGLALVKKIVELHGGDIKLESTVGEGTTFYFSLKKM
ncbi:PAS domain S-box protein [Aureisphaera galaxeae]|uniref:PAS domain S-box protein n=1 Tax=Aureisphaera galaxeae TaxID=1538023 RepID=UPI0023507979|nr:PAS domain S-box protein [Aureisphaera galaxeae]MDC8005693.1 PAS domain S-box protein [Aureisphaera galaxeae]